ncbi:DUF389 domain-containing protein [Rubripirellula amarantea]|uniref:DUF389 domain-containing protein n=1 Tax=Rubripirellula amarantea TaxID=2527999 RepID=A0A5C5WUH0_9BACT|nr:DUF389 domain-containing protein [Rubripirellula amarantea]MDA8742991.1 DUF389 domain-containing protein [Rubripirellula amarantea]TWT53665.1 hypothetical protein Pla22_12950 [Rubripirellula amarantea]
MSVLFLVDSQSELQAGLPWIEKICEQDSNRRPALVYVLGTDRTSLLAYAREVADKCKFIGSVDPIEENTSAIIEITRKNRDHTVVLVSDGDQDDKQQEIFRKSANAVVWFRIHGDPPTSSKQVFGLDAASLITTPSFVSRLLGVSPEHNLIEPSDLAVSDDRSISDIVIGAYQKRCDPGDLLCLDWSPSLDKQQSAARLALFRQASHASILLYHPGETWLEQVASRFRGIASVVAKPMDREQRIELSESLQEGSQPSFEFLGLISAAAMLAAFGLLQDSAAVIIGAMLVAPLMTPILGAGMALTHGNRPLFRNSLIAITIGFVGALASSFIFGLLVRTMRDIEITPEMWARCNPSPLDFCVGLVGGIAASYARTRSHLSSALAGAAIAAALVPPLSTAGLQLAGGFFEATDRGTPIVGPILLVTINVLTIMVGSSFVLYLRGLQSDPSVLRRDRWGLRMFVLISILACFVLAFIVH